MNITFWYHLFFSFWFNLNSNFVILIWIGFFCLLLNSKRVDVNDKFMQMASNGIFEEFIHISSIIRIIPQITFNAYLEEVALNIYRSLKEESLKRGKKNPKPKISEFQFLSFVNRLLKCFFFNHMKHQSENYVQVHKCFPENYSQFQRKRIQWISILNWRATSITFSASSRQNYNLMRF